MSKGSHNIIPIVTCFRAFLLRAMAATISVVAVSSSSTPAFLPPDDIIEEMIDEIAESYGMDALLNTWKRQRTGASNDSMVVHKKRQMIKYDRVRARQCVMADWMGPTPLFDGKQFERTFRLRRSMVESIVCHLANHDSFWTSTRNALGFLSIDPLVKFVAAQKLICYGSSFSAFKDYCQMGESTARLCMSKLCRGIVECDEISAYYLRTPSQRDARYICNLHKRVHGVDGLLGFLDVLFIFLRRRLNTNLLFCCHLYLCLGHNL